MEIANFEIEHDLTLGASAQLNEGTEEICQNLLHEVLVQVTHKTDCGGVDLNETA